MAASPANISCGLMSDEPVAPPEATAVLLQWAGVAVELYQALRDAQLPEQLASDLTFAWMTDTATDDD